MDIICSEDPSYVYRGFPCIKALYGRLSADLAFPRVLLPIAQFYLNHSECPTTPINPPLYLKEIKIAAFPHGPSSHAFNYHSQITGL